MVWNSPEISVQNSTLLVHKMHLYAQPSGGREHKYAHICFGISGMYAYYVYNAAWGKGRFLNTVFFIYRGKTVCSEIPDKTFVFSTPSSPLKSWNLISLFYQILPAVKWSQTWNVGNIRKALWLVSGWSMKVASILMAPIDTEAFLKTTCENIWSCYWWCFLPSTVSTSADFKGSWGFTWRMWEGHWLDSLFSARLALIMLTFTFLS